MGLTPGWAFLLGIVAGAPLWVQVGRAEMIFMRKAVIWAHARRWPSGRRRA